MIHAIRIVICSILLLPCSLISSDTLLRQTQGAITSLSQFTGLLSYSSENHTVLFASSHNTYARKTAYRRINIMAANMRFSYEKLYNDLKIDTKQSIFQGKRETFYTLYESIKPWIFDAQAYCEQHPLDIGDNP